MKSLKTLIRLRRQSLDRARLRLVALETKQAGLTEAMEQLAARLLEEKAAAAGADDFLVYYPGFAEGTRGRLADLAEQRRAVDIDVDEAREAVRAAFAEMKKFEIALASRQRRERAEADRRQRIALDELAIDLYRRTRTVC